METAYTDQPHLELRREGEHRILSVCAVPYGQITMKAGPRPERVRAGAFARAVNHADRIRLVDENHAHARRPVGVGVQMVDRPDGIYSDFRFYNTPEGRAALENVEEQTYSGVSGGFIVDEEADVDGVREIRSARLIHVSLVDEPAYDGARILDLRTADRYAALIRKPDMSILDEDVDDTPMTLRLAQVLGNVRVES